MKITGSLLHQQQYIRANLNQKQKKQKNKDPLYNEILKNKCNNIIKKDSVDKENHKSYSTKKNQISPDKKDKKNHKKSIIEHQIKILLKNSRTKKKKDLLKVLNKTQDLKPAPQHKNINPNLQIRKSGKSAEYRRYPRKGQQDYEQALSLSSKKRNIAKQLKKTLGNLKQKMLKSNMDPNQNNESWQTSKMQSLRYLKQSNEFDKRKDVSLNKQKKDGCHESKRFYTQNTHLKKKKIPYEKKRKSTFISVQETPHIKKYKTSMSKQIKQRNNLSTLIGQKQMNIIDSNLIRYQTQEDVMEQIKKQNQIQKVLLTQADQFNLNEFREFQQKANKLFKTQSSQNKINERIKLEDKMARIIQKWWKKYLQKKILKNYMKIFDTSKPRIKIEKIPNIQILNKNRKQDFFIKQIQTLQKNQSLFQNRQKQSQFEYVHNSNKYKKAIKEIKLDQLKKWNQMIQLIEKTIKQNNKQQTKRLLQLLAERSQLNKKNLELKTDTVLDKLQTFQQSKFREINQDFHSIEQSISNSSRSNAIYNLKNKKYDLEIPSEQFQNKSIYQFIDHEQYQQRKIENKKVFNLNKQILQKFSKLKKSKLVPQSQKIDQNSTQIKNKRNLNETNQILYKSEDEGGSSSHKLLPFLSINQYIEDQDPLQMLQATQKLKKKIESMNSKILDQEMQIEIQQEQEELQYFAPKLIQNSYYLRNENEQKNKCPNKDSSSSIFSKLQYLMQLNINKQKTTDQITNFLIKQIINQFIIDISTQQTIFNNFSRKISNSLATQPRTKKIVYHNGKKMKGINTNLNSIKEYLKNLISFLSNKKNKILINLKKPNGPSAIEMLNCMRNYQISYPSEEGQTVVVLPYQFFEQHWEQYQVNLRFEPFFVDIQKQKKRQIYVKGISKIHCRLLFDAFNQNLDYERSFGQFGKPFPWKTLPNFGHEFTDQKYSDAIQKAYQKTLEFATTYCGVIFDNQKQRIQQSEIKRIRQDKLARSLAIQLLQAEEKWIFYDDQQIEVLLEITTKVCDFLLQQILNEIKFIAE